MRRKTTLLKDAEEATRRSEEHLRLALESGHLSPWERDLATGELDNVTAAHKALYGLGPEAAFTTADRDRAVHREDLPRLRACLDEAVRTGRTVAVEFRVTWPDGSERWLCGHGQAIYDDAGRPIRLIGATQDITEQKAAEAALRESHGLLRESHERLEQNERRLRLALEHGSFGSFELDDAAGRFLAVSDTFKAQFGLPPDAPFSLDTLSAMVHPDDRDRIREVVREARAGCRGFQAEHRVVWPDGSVHWISAQATRLVDSGGRCGPLIGLIQDITGRKILEAERERLLAETKRLLAEAEERADRDPLTDLLNHRAFHKLLEEGTVRARRGHASLAVVMLDLDNFRFFNDCYGHSVGDEVLLLVADQLRRACRRDDVVARFGGDEFAMLLSDVGETTAPEIEARLRGDLRNMGFQPAGWVETIPITVSLGAALLPRGGMEGNDRRHSALDAADARLRVAKSGGGVVAEAEQVRLAVMDHVAGFSMLDALVTAVDNKDRYTRRHSEDVMAYSLQIAEVLGLSEAERQTVSVAALIHDVGKIGVPDAILRKPGNLTDAEFEAVKQHPQMGAIMVQAVPGLEGTLDAVRHHHERWDGAGYPFGLRGLEIPLTARLMAVADAFSAMTTDRPYRKGMPHARALSILETGEGTQWDAECVTAFLNAQRAGPT